MKETSPEKSDKVKISPFESGIAGAFSGFITRAILQPLDVLKIRFQLQVEPTFGNKGGLYHGIYQAFKTIYKQQGLYELWRGHVPAQILTISYGAAQFWSYSFLKQQTLNLGYENEGFTQTMCGGFAGLVGNLVSMPFDVIRTRRVAQSIPQYKGMLDILIKMVRTEGIFSLWKGLGPNLMMNVPNTAIQFRLYYYLSSLFPEANFKKEHGGTLDKLLYSSKSTICGATAGLCAKFTVYPLDVLKKRMQLRGSEQIRKHFGKVVTYSGVVDCIIKLSKEEGILGWYKGLGPTLIKSATFSGLVFTFYELSCSSILYLHTMKEVNR